MGDRPVEDRADDLIPVPPEVEAFRVKCRFVFHVGMRVVGVYLVIYYGSYLIQLAVHLARPQIGTNLIAGAPMGKGALIFWLHQFTVGGLTSMIRVAIGLYFVFGGQWMTRVVFTGIYEACWSCGYSLRGSQSVRCSECGAATDFGAEDAKPIEASQE